MPSIKTTHPILMVSEVVSFSVVIYHNADRPKLDAELLRQSLISQLPAGAGVGPVVVTMHGQYEPEREQAAPALFPPPAPGVFITPTRANWIAKKLKMSAADAVEFLRELERA